MIYLHENGVTVVATEDAKRGKVYELNGENYYVARGISDIQKIVESGEYPLNRVVTSKLTTLNYLFQIQGGYTQKAVPDTFNDDISNWDTSNVLSMEEVFSGWPKFNGDISNWDTSNVESMYGMFKSSKYKGSYHMGPTSFNQDISKWDVSSVKNMSEMFLGATSFNQNISNWDVSNVESMEFMFSGAKSFNQDISKWDVSNVKKMSNMFSDIDSIGIVAFVGTLEYTRCGSSTFNQPIGNWDVSKVNDMNGMFSGAKSFNQPIGSWDVSNVIDMSGMFSGAKSFNQPIGNWDVSNLSSTRDIFNDAESFNQPIDNWDVSNVFDMNGMFSGAKSFNQPIGNWDVSNVNNMEEVFSGASSFNQPIGNWDVSKVNSMRAMFKSADDFNQNISSWDVSNVIQMKEIFQDAITFNQNIRNWNLNDKLPKSPTIFKGAKSFNIKEFNPFLNRKSKKRQIDSSTANLSSEDKKTISKIKKLLIERDFEKIDLGLELLISLNNLELFETLLLDCKIGQDFSNLIRNKFFTGSGPAQPYLDYALINIIANTPQDAKIDDSLLIKNISVFNSEILTLKTDGYYNGIPRFLPLDKFTYLSELIIDFDRFNLKGQESNEDVDSVNIESMFPTSIISLKSKNTKGSLKWLKNFNKLETLEIDFNSYKQVIDLDFNHLVSLQDLKFNTSTFENLDFLADCKNIKRLDLNITYSSSSYSNDVRLDNINFLNKLKELEVLNIFGLGDFLNLDDLSFSNKLKKLSLKVDTGVNLGFLLSCKQIKELTLNISDDIDLKILKNCESLESLKVLGFSHLHLYGTILDINGLKELTNLKTISINPEYNRSLKFSGYGDGNLMTSLNDTASKSSSANNDKLRINKEDVIIIRDIINYKGLPFNGTVYYNTNENLFYEYEVVNGLMDGIYREFYSQTNLDSTEKIKFEAKYNNNKIVEILGFYNLEGINVVKDSQCIPNYILEFKNSQFYYDDSPFTGFCFLELDTKVPSRYGTQPSSMYNQSLFDLLVKSKPNTLSNEKVSVMLRLENGILTKDILVCTKNKYIKMYIEDSYLSLIKNEFYSGLQSSPLSQLSVVLESENKTNIKSLDGMSIVISGVFENYSRAELIKIIEDRGGKSVSSISKNVSFLLAGSKMGPKKKIKAEELNIKIIDVNEFIEKYNSNP